MWRELSNIKILVSFNFRKLENTNALFKRRAKRCTLPENCALSDGDLSDYGKLKSFCLFVSHLPLRYVIQCYISSMIGEVLPRMLYGEGLFASRTSLFPCSPPNGKRRTTATCISQPPLPTPSICLWPVGGTDGKALMQKRKNLDMCPPFSLLGEASEAIGEAICRFHWHYLLSLF